LYGAAEFSRDTDLALLASAENLTRLSRRTGRGDGPAGSGGEQEDPQRDKDWPMIRRLVEVSYLNFRDDPTPSRVDFWLRELRTPLLLGEVVDRFGQEARAMADRRPAVQAALADGTSEIERALQEEEQRERDADRAYGSPLVAELEALRRAQRRDAGP
jgi:hypothetical protein